MNVEALKEALHIFATEDIDFRKIVLELAEEYPEIFVRIHRGHTFDQVEATQKELLTERPDVIDLIERAKVEYVEQDRNVIRTIREMRHKYNLGLAEAKNIVDRARLELQTQM